MDICKRPAEQFRAFQKACVDAVELLTGEGAELLVVGNSESKCFPRELLPYTTRTTVNGGGSYQSAGMVCFAGCDTGRLSQSSLFHMPGAQSGQVYSEKKKCSKNWKKKKLR